MSTAPHEGGWPPWAKVSLREPAEGWEACRMPNPTAAMDLQAAVGQGPLGGRGGAARTRQQKDRQPWAA